MSSLTLEQKAKQLVAAAIHSRDAARKPGLPRLGMLFVGSALLHIVAVIALFHSWDTGSLQTVKHDAPVAQRVVEEVPVVRLELAVAPASASEIAKATEATFRLPVEPTAKTAAKAVEPDQESLELRPATGTNRNKDQHRVAQETNSLRTSTPEK